MSIIDPIASYACSNPQNLAVVDLEPGRHWTYAELHAAVDRVAAWLVGELGAASGARIATLSKNCAEMLMLQHAGVRAGAIFVPFNWRLSPTEIEILADDAVAHDLTQMNARDRKHGHRAFSSFSDREARGPGLKRSSEPIDPPAFAGISTWHTGHR